MTEHRKVTLQQHGVPPDLEDEEPTNPRIKRSNYFTRLMSLGVAGGFSVATLGGMAYAFDSLEHRAKDAGADAAKTEVVGLRATVDADHAVLQVVVKQQAQQSDDTHELQKDVRALYKAVLTGQPQERLERPPTPKDGGSP